jgi:hypothetical protein
MFELAPFYAAGAFFGVRCWVAGEVKTPRPEARIISFDLTVGSQWTHGLGGLFTREPNPLGRTDEYDMGRLAHVDFP